MKKTGGRKSRDTLPLSKLVLKKLSKCIDKTALPYTYIRGSRHSQIKDLHIAKVASGHSNANLT